MILNYFEGPNLALASLKISHLEQLSNEIFALLSASFYYLKIDHLIKRIGIRQIGNPTIQKWKYLYVG
ncbi:hypothetical protein CWB66_05470 [Pseudoalteromonas sp. S558]|nr:hypothetical protein CWB66_05470 [Pseudoalteromonas sp. S558]